jgi:hypothetical protein
MLAVKVLDGRGAVEIGELRLVRPVDQQLKKVDRKRSGVVYLKFAMNKF